MKLLVQPEDGIAPLVAAVKSAKKADKKSANAALKKCQDANKPAGKKKGGK